MYPENLKYTDTHEWVKVEGDIATIGVTEYAIEELGDIVYVELPPVGTKISKGDAFGSIESVKTVSDLISPVSGVIANINEALNNAPEVLSEDAYTKGWMIKLQLANAQELSELATADEYAQSLKEH